jgi:hypothetical protein
MNDFVPVSIRMAKDQNISLNPTKISGLCGRLMCCLQFEHENYVDARKLLPRVGADVMTPDGPGEVVDIQILKEILKVRVTLPDMSLDMREYHTTRVQIISKEEREQAEKELAAKAPVVVPRPPRPAPEPRPPRTWQKAKAPQGDSVAAAVEETETAERPADPVEAGEVTAEEIPKATPSAQEETPKSQGGSRHRRSHRRNSGEDNRPAPAAAPSEEAPKAPGSNTRHSHSFQSRRKGDKLDHRGTQNPPPAPGDGQ